MSETIRLRPHHLLCMLNFIGKGYSEAFIKNFDSLMQKMNKGDITIEIVAGPDDVCTPCLTEADCHCRDDHKHNEDVATLPELRTVQGLETIDFGFRFSPTTDVIERLRHAFTAHKIRRGCRNCEWFDVCTEISQNGYKEAKLK